MGFGSSMPDIGVGLGVIEGASGAQLSSLGITGPASIPSPPLFYGTDWGGIARGAGSLVGGAAKYAGGYLGIRNKYTAAKAESTMMQSEADIMDYNADLARWEGIISDRERDIEIDQHRDSVRRILGKQATYYAWGNIDLDDPKGTPAQVRLRSLYNAEYNEGIIIERGFVKKRQAGAKADIYEYQASVIRSAAGVVKEAGKVSRTAGLLSLTGELLKDTGVLENA